MKKNNLKGTLAGLGAAAVVAIGAILGNQIHKNNQEKEALAAQKQTLISQIYSNPSLDGIQSYQYSDELKALQTLINRQLPADKQMKEDGYLPNSEKDCRRLAEFELALDGMSNDQLQALGTNLSEKIDMTILDTWAKGDVSNDARAAFNRMIKRRADQNNNDGSATMEMQRALNAVGANLTVDGDFGPKTQQALDKVFSSKGGIQAFAKHYKAERLKSQNARSLMAQQARGR